MTTHQRDESSHHHGDEARASEPSPAIPDETPDLYGAYPRLTEHQIGALAAGGERRPTRAGEVLYREGETQQQFFVVLSGTVAIVEGLGGEEQVLGVHGFGRFLGEISLLTGEAAFVSAVVRDPGEVLAVPVDELRRLVTEDIALGDLVLRAFLIRRSILIEVGAGFRILGSCFSPDTRRLLEFAARNRLPHRFINLDGDSTAEALLRELGVAPDETPVVVWNGRDVMRNPGPSELARVIGLPVSRPGRALSDLLIVGAGPAGLAAAVYGASEGLSTIVIDSIACGGQAAASPRIENYLGFPAGLPGGELAERAIIQAEKFGAHLQFPAPAVGLERDDGNHAVRLDDGSTICSRAVVIATGARYRKLDVRRLEDFEGTSVYYAATLVEARMCVGDPVVVVGGGNSAGQAALFLARHTPQVCLLVRHDDLNRDMSRYLADRIRNDPAIEVMTNAEVRDLVGDEALEAVVVEETTTGHRRQQPARALFVFIGAEPHTGWLDDQVELDEDGFVVTGPGASRQGDGSAAWPADRQPLALETSRAGVFAVGDVRSGAVRRVASAVGEGAMAVRMVHQYLAEVGAAVAPPGTSSSRALVPTC